MDTTRKISKKGKRGSVTILVAGIMVAFILMFLVVGIDFAYVYYVRGELQNAADAAALAGAAKLNPLNMTDLTQCDARIEAVKFAQKNRAAQKNVFLAANGTDGSTCTSGDNTLSESNDITVGHWDGSAYTAGVTPVNAIEVRPRRRGSDPNNPAVGLIFGGRLINWPTMNVVRRAVASRPARGTAPVGICVNTCTNLDLTTPKLLYWAPYPSEAIPGTQGIAWTNFATSQWTNTDDLMQYFCGKSADVCNMSIYTNNGNINTVSRQFRCAFKNPLYDSTHKTCNGGNHCISSSDVVDTWYVIVPYFEAAACPPGSPPSPYQVIGYAEIGITEVYASGGGGTNKCACGAYNAGHTTGPTDNAILIKSIKCLDCEAAKKEFMGNTATLVR